MAVSTLSKFTVPLASDQSATNQGMLMPKLKYRFRISFENFGVSTPTTELTKQVATAARPNVQFEDVPIQVYNSMIHLAGRPKWQTMAVTLRDDVTGAVSKLVGEQMQKQFDFFEQASAASGLDYKFTAYIELLDGGNGAYDPIPLETFEMQGCWIKSVAYDGGDYSKSNETMNVEITVCYDNAVQTIGINGGLIGVGTPVGRTVGTTAIGS